MPHPTFLVIGAAKAGTTSLYEYLKLHPQVFMSSVKETNFFALESRGYEGFWHGYALSGPRKPRQVVDTWDKYEELFRDAHKAKAVGEVCPSYLYVPEVPARVRHYLPEAKIIAIFRNPVDRAYSHYLYYMRDGREKQDSFLAALQEEEARARKGYVTTWSYVGMGYYHAQIMRYLEHFDRSQVRLYLFEDLHADPNGLLEDICRFIDVDPSLLNVSLERHNPSGLPRSRFLQNILIRNNLLKRALGPLISPSRKQWLQARLQRFNLRSAPPMPPDAREYLISVYREDILKLQELIGRDLSHWLTPSPREGGAVSKRSGPTAALPIG